MADNLPARGELMMQLTDEVFRFNGVLLVEGDALAATAGLTAAQWQVLGRLADEPMTVAGLALRRGLRRQSVQEVVDRLERRHLLAKQLNPQDRRAPLLSLTETGRAALRAIEPSRAAWAESRAGDLSTDDIVITLRTLQRLRAMNDAPDRKVLE